MKLLFYIPGLVDGGAERVIASLASHFAIRGFEVLLAVEYAVATSAPPIDPGVKIITLASGHAGAVRHLARLMKSERPDIALSAIASCNFKLTMARLIARLSGNPRTAIVLTWHGFEEYKSGWMSWLGYVTLPLISRIAARVVTVSDSLRNELATRWKAKKQNIQRIYNPVAVPPPPADFSPPENAAALLEREKIILSAGRLVEGKRFDLLIRAFAKTTDPAARLIILGEGPQRPALKALIDELDLGARIELAGFTTDTGSYYAKARCFVLVSKQESFGLVLVEALAYGLPVLSSESGGPSEVLQGGQYGVLLDENPNTSELSLAIDALLEKPGNPAPRIEHARSFDMQTGARQYTELFEQILRHKN